MAARKEPAPCRVCPDPVVAATERPACPDSSEPAASKPCPLVCESTDRSAPETGAASRPLSLPSHPSSSVTPLVIIAYERGSDLKQCLDSIIKYLPRDGSVRLYVSQDGKHESIPQVVSDFNRRFPELAIELWQHPHELPHAVPPGEQASYHFIATHYKRALSKVFSLPDREPYQEAILLEEDIIVAPDFFEYFQAFSPLLHQDKSLLCISAFNDNGKPEHVADPLAVYRTDFFPGLGWMLTRDLWESDLGPKWAKGYWDDWLRLPANRQGRSCLRPEISRTKTIGREGTSKGQWYDTHLSKIKLNDVPILWRAVDVGALFSKENYDSRLLSETSSSQAIPISSLGAATTPGAVYTLSYSSFANFQVLARELGIMDDEKSGVPRTAYRGIVTVRRLVGPPGTVPAKIHLVPSNSRGFYN